MWRVRYRTSFVPSFRMTSGCVLTKTPAVATSRSIESRMDLSRPPSMGLTPHQNAVDSHKLFSNVCAKIIVIYRRLNVNPPGGEGPEQICKTAILRSCVLPRLTIAGGENCHSQVTILRHWRS